MHGGTGWPRQGPTGLRGRRGSRGPPTGGGRVEPGCAGAARSACLSAPTAAWQWGQVCLSRGSVQRFALALLAVWQLGGCGQRGPLTLPTRDGETPAVPAAEPVLEEGEPGRPDDDLPP